MRFNHVFYLLLVLSALSAFVIPQAMTDGLQPAMGSLLWPVAGPSRSLAGWATGRAGPGTPVDDRPPDTIVAENLDLKQTIARLQYELNEYRQRDAEHAKLGDLRDLCKAVSVIGAENARDVLTVGSTSLAGLANRMPVLHERDIVGELRNVGPGGAQVLLVTDVQSRIRATFATFRKTGGATTVPAAARDDNAVEFVRLGLPPRLVEGRGGGRIICENIPVAEARKAGLAEGDWVVLDDPDWPKAVQGRRLGVVKKVVVGNKLMAEVEIRPEIDLKALREVMVLVKDR